MKNTRTAIGAIVALLSLPLTACSDGDAATTGGTGSVKVQISGEEAGTDGFLFPTGSEVTLADGWEIQFSHVLVTIGNVTLAENPDRAPSDQSRIGSIVASADGPWAIDLHEEGEETGAGGEGKAVLLTTLSDASLAADQRYAFNFDTLAADDDAEKVNFDGDAETEALYSQMVTAGYSVMYTGTATFKGTNCEVSDDTYDFAQIPTEFDFQLGFATPTSYVNCQNEENQGDPFPDEEYQRGIPILSNDTSLAQITLHLEHAFYSDVQHEPAIYFGQMAARLVGQAAGTVLTNDDLIGVDPTALTDGENAALPWRICDGSALPAGDQMGFEVGSVPLDPSADPSDALRDYRDYVNYLQSTQGHLNGGEGLCYIDRNYPSPP
jgi:hypothetical protein